MESTRNSILRISDEKTIQLIQEWEKEECLWNTNLIDYPNTRERLIAADKIAKKLNIPNFTREHVNAKFKNLRNSYCQELRKVANDNGYKPKVFWFPCMDKYLRPHLQKIKGTNIVYNRRKERHRRGTPILIKTEVISDDEEWSVENSTQSEASCSQSHVKTESIAESVSDSENESIEQPSQETQEPQAKKRRISRQGDSVDERTDSENGEYLVHSRLDTADVESNEPRRQEETDKLSIAECQTDYLDTFGAYVASLLRTMPAKKALALQPAIIEMIVAVSVSNE